MLAFIKQHGRMILYCVAAVLVLAIAFGISLDGKKGMILIAAQKAAEHMEAVDIRTERDVNAVMAAAARRRPKITYTGTNAVSGTAVNLKEMFSAADADGISVAVEITDVLDVSGKSVLYETKEQRKHKTGKYDPEGFVFSTAGIYTVHVKAVDREKKVSRMKFRLPVT